MCRANSLQRRWLLRFPMHKVTGKINVKDPSWLWLWLWLCWLSHLSRAPISVCEIDSYHSFLFLLFLLLLLLLPSSSFYLVLSFNCTSLHIARLQESQPSRNPDVPLYESGCLPDSCISWSINCALPPQFSSYDRFRWQSRGHSSLRELHRRFLQGQCYRFPRWRRFRCHDLHSPNGNLALPRHAWPERVGKLDRSVAGRRANGPWKLLWNWYHGTFDLGWF